jgi:hypothetical protein
MSSSLVSMLGVLSRYSIAFWTILVTACINANHALPFMHWLARVAD